MINKTDTVLEVRLLFISGGWILTEKEHVTAFIMAIKEVLILESNMEYDSLPGKGQLKLQMKLRLLNSR